MAALVRTDKAQIADREDVAKQKIAVLKDDVAAATDVPLAAVIACVQS
jgi:hypothetical protein